MTRLYTRGGDRGDRVLDPVEQMKTRAGVRQVHPAVVDVIGEVLAQLLEQARHGHAAALGQVGGGREQHVLEVADARAEAALVVAEQVI